MRTLLLAVLLACPAVGQVIDVQNHLAAPWNGWVRTTVDVRPPHDAGQVGAARYRLGRQVGVDVWVLDLQLELGAGERRQVDLAGAAPWSPPAVPLPGLDLFGGVPKVAGVPMPLVGLWQDGAAWTAHWRARTGRLLVCDLWTTWRPDQPALVQGEATLTASDPSIPDVKVTIPAGGVWISWGDGLWPVELAPAGESWGDGQARTLPVVWFWPGRMPHWLVDAGPWVQVVAARDKAVQAVGVRELWAGQGNPRLPPGLNADAWTTARWNGAHAASKTWQVGVTGPWPLSGVTGAQGDMVFVAGETKLEPGALPIHQLGAYKWANRPNHYRRTDGSLMDPTDRGPVMFFNGRPHSATGDLLGKERGISPDDTSGWFGPDSQHWFSNELVVTARQTGSPALQLELEQQAMLYLWQETVPSQRPGWYTSSYDSSRSVAWTMILAVHLHKNLADRALAERVRARAIARIREVYVPAFAATDWWDVRIDDPRLGPGPWIVSWQECAGAYGLDLASEYFDVPEGRAAARRAARAMLRDCWRLEGETWVSAPVFPVPTVGAAELDFEPPVRQPWVHEDTGVPLPGGTEDAAAAPLALFDGSFNWFGMSMCVPVVLKEDPNDERARAVWAQLLDTTRPGDLAWLAPEIGELPPIGPPKVGSIDRGPFRWTFAAPAQAGRFVNGDPWVVGPVTVIGITPASGVVGGRYRNGSMLNPTASCSNGYDSASFFNYNDGKFQSSLSLQLPVTVQTGSIVSSWSDDATTSQQPDEHGQYGFLRDAAVLTVLPAPPPPDAFRPPYVGTDKTIRGTLADLDWSALASLPPAPDMPDVADLRQRLGHLWLDHCPEWVSRYLHTRAGLPDYYRGFTSEIGTAALAVNCAGLPADVRKDLVVGLVQIGLDNFAVVQNGGRWGVNGHCNGRKFPVLFAGRMLNDPQLLGAGAALRPIWFAPGDVRNRKVPWSEDGQVFYVEQTSPGVFNWGFGGYTAAHVGLPEWGNFHLDQISSDSAEWFAPPGYRVCCSANGWVGQVLAARIMGLQDAWAWPAMFDYQDRYMQTMPVGDWQRAWIPWHGAMWDAYRGSF